MTLATDTIIAHISNHEPYYLEAREIVSDSDNEYDAAIDLKFMVERIMFPEGFGESPSMDVFFQQDMILESLSRVNWREVYESLIDE